MHQWERELIIVLDDLQRLKFKVPNLNFWESPFHQLKFSYLVKNKKFIELDIWYLKKTPLYLNSMLLPLGNSQSRHPDRDNLQCHKCSYTSAWGLWCSAPDFPALQSGCPAKLHEGSKAGPYKTYTMSIRNRWA